jgi:flagellar hook protein FlgE
MDVSAIALQGLQQAQTQLENTAQRLSAAGSSADGTPVDTADLSQAAVALLTAKNQFNANINVLKVADQMQKSVINLLG